MKIIQKIFDFRDNHNNSNIYFRHLFYGSSPPFPVFANLMITRRCNLNCSFCSLESPEEMEWKRVLITLKMMGQFGVKKINITGGEPLLHPNILEILKTATDLDMKISLSTNGTLLTKYAKELSKFNNLFIGVSLDGATPKTHDVLRGKEGLFKEIMAGLKKLSKYFPVSRIGIDMVITNKNIDELFLMHDLAQKIGVKVSFNPVQGYPDLYPSSDKQINKYLSFIRTHRFSLFRCTKNWTYWKKVVSYWKDTLGKTRCAGLSFGFGVDVKGNLRTCCVWGGGYALGNVFNTPLKELWNSKEAYKIRKKIFNGGCTTSCYNITYLNLFTSTTMRNFLVK